MASSDHNDALLSDVDDEHAGGAMRMSCATVSRFGDVAAVRVTEEVRCLACAGCPLHC